MADVFDEEVVQFLEGNEVVRESLRDTGEKVEETLAEG